MTVRRRTARLGVTAIAFFLVQGQGSQADPWTPVPRSFFGMHIHQTSNYPTVPTGALGKGSCVNWEYVQPSRGVYNWSILDAYVNLAQQKGIDIFYSNDAVPAWAASNPSTCVPSGCNPNILTCGSAPANEQDLINFYTALVTRYKGKIKYYELWNEPYQEPNITTAQLVRMTTDEYNIIRANDPGAQIITPSMAGDSPSHVQYAANYFAAGGPTGVDIASLHAYPDSYSKSADVPEAVMPDRYLFGPLLPVLIQYLPNKPLWDTEGSWNLTGVGNFTTPAQEAAFIARWYILHWSNGISRTYWYAWDDSELGTLMPSMVGSSVPATAFDQIQNWLVGRGMTTACAAAADSVTWTCGLAGLNGYQGLIVWNTAGTGSYTPPSSGPLSGNYKNYRNLAGNVTGYSGGAVTVGISPILLGN
jgi:Glycosyl hydrolase family 10